MKLLRVLLGLFVVLGVLTGCEGSYRTQVRVGTLSVPAGGTGVVRISILNPPDAKMIQVGPTGFLTFNPSVIQVTGLTGVNGFTVSGSVINNTMGWVQFVASFPGGSIRPIVASGLGVLEIPIVEMSVQAVGPVGAQTALTITAVDLFTDRVGQPIPIGPPIAGQVVIIAP
ncbi:hypothetical protein HRbin07_00456 [bacterium HR07]|uniref:Lipoprotein n=1 Tax=Acetithermum autotrophicum TaxID=1446466 RepID=H5SSJ0_ACEAU|nr:hypothetical protein HGMM_OP3C281 [Candidatus Acetothermum autotrophicum]GBC76257.1 hypothetical protein HRbin07_00456 [bacterium HR07]